MQVLVSFSFGGTSLGGYRYENITKDAPLYSDIDKLIAELKESGIKDITYYGFNYSKYAHGGYPLYYITEDNACLCPNCANENKALRISNDPQWKIIAMDANYEDTSLYCDHCSKQIPSAYGDDDSTADGT